jgi:NAD(P)-dependent dehydrogenase (short-subunit alcohol dehydrogenase family)
VARALAGSGARVTAGSLRSLPELGKVAARSVLVDLATPGGPGELVAAAVDRIDALVNNVGAARPRTGGFLAVTDEEWLASLALNLMAAVRCRLPR